MEHTAILKSQGICSSANCKSHILATSDEDGGSGNRPRFLAVIDCDDFEAIARLRQILPDAALLGMRVARVEASNGGNTRRPRSDSQQRLTPRQREILRGLLEGRSNKEIARTLGLSHFTVRNHVSQLLQLLNVTSRKDLAGFLSDPAQGIAA